jgi:cell division cycle 14
MAAGNANLGLPLQAARVMSSTPDELTGAVEIIPGLLYFQCLQQPFAAVTSPIAASNTCYYLDNDLIYEPFCADFGPCNLAHTYRFCTRVNALLQQVGQRAGA